MKSGRIYWKKNPSKTPNWLNPFDLINTPLKSFLSYTLLSCSLYFTEKNAHRIPAQFLLESMVIASKCALINKDPIWARITVECCTIDGWFLYFKRGCWDNSLLLHAVLFNFFLTFPFISSVSLIFHPSCSASHFLFSYNMVHKESLLSATVGIYSAMQE